MLVRSRVSLYRNSVADLIPKPQMLIGFARVWPTHQSLDRWLAMLKAEGCKQVFGK
jgi:hypothetical protein